MRTRPEAVSWATGWAVGGVCEGQEGFSCTPCPSVSLLSLVSLCTHIPYSTQQSPRPTAAKLLSPILPLPCIPRPSRQKGALRSQLAFLSMLLSRLLPLPGRSFSSAHQRQDGEH